MAPVQWQSKKEKERLAREAKDTNAMALAAVAEEPLLTARSTLEKGGRRGNVTARGGGTATPRAPEKEGQLALVAGSNQQAMAHAPTPSLTFAYASPCLRLTLHLPLALSLHLPLRMTLPLLDPLFLPMPLNRPYSYTYLRLPVSIPLSLLQDSKQQAATPTPTMPLPGYAGYSASWLTDCPEQ